MLRLIPAGLKLRLLTMLLDALGDRLPRDVVILFQGKVGALLAIARKLTEAEIQQLEQTDAPKAALLTGVLTGIDQARQYLKAAQRSDI